jgi:hypothetical protein
VENYGSDNEGGIISFDREQVEEGLKTETDKDSLEILRDILKDIKKEDFVEYYCY